MNFNLISLIVRFNVMVLFFILEIMLILRIRKSATKYINQELSTSEGSLALLSHMIKKCNHICFKQIMDWSKLKDRGPKRQNGNFHQISQNNDLNSKN